MTARPQLDIFLDQACGTPKMVRDFEIFDQENPEVYEIVKKYTFQAIDSGRQRFGIAMIYERVRWYIAIETRGDTFKLNNNFKAFYARKFIHEYPQHKDFFELRSSIADRYGENR